MGLAQIYGRKGGKNYYTNFCAACIVLAYSSSCCFWLDTVDVFPVRPTRACCDVFCTAELPVKIQWQSGKNIFAIVMTTKQLKTKYVNKLEHEAYKYLAFLLVDAATPRD